MQSALRIMAEVQPGEKIEVADAQLPVGASSKLIVLLPQAAPSPRRSVLDVLADAPGSWRFKRRTMLMRTSVRSVRHGSVELSCVRPGLCRCECGHLCYRTH